MARVGVMLQNEELGVRTRRCAGIRGIGIGLSWTGGCAESPAASADGDARDGCKSLCLRLCPRVRNGSYDIHVFPIPFSIPFPVVTMVWIVFLARNVVMRVCGWRRGLFRGPAWVEDRRVGARA